MKKLDMQPFIDIDIITSNWATKIQCNTLMQRILYAEFLAMKEAELALRPETEDHISRTCE